MESLSKDPYPPSSGLSYAAAARANESDPLLREQERGASYYGEESSSTYSGGRLVVRGGKPHSCAVCCTIFSLVGVIYLCCLGLYASSGLRYLHGGWEQAQTRTVTRNLFFAAFLYLVTLGISLYYWAKASRTGAGILKGQYSQMRNLDD